MGLTGMHERAILLGGRLVLSDRPGGGTLIGTEAAARAAPDGSTLLLVANSFVINAVLKRQSYDPLTSFEPICQLVTSPTVIVVNAESRFRTLADLLDAARAKPGEVTLASTGVFQVAIEQLNSNPSSALALADQFTGAERREFLDTVLGAWADAPSITSWSPSPEAFASGEELRPLSPESRAIGALTFTPSVPSGIG